MPLIDNVKNRMEKIIKDEIERFLKDRDDICKCEQCRADMYAYALNHLPPKYVVSDRGDIHFKTDIMSVQMQADITRVVLEAIEVVSKRPRHGNKKVE